MTTCPNCGRAVSDSDDVCKNCGFNLKKYREDFFTNEENVESKGTAEKVVSRAAYRRESQTVQQNTTVQKMIAWLRANAMIVFLIGVFLLIIMSFSRSIGWISFFALMTWLYIICDRKSKIEQYTADERLTEEINKYGSKIFNSVETGSQKLRSRGQKFEESHPKVEEHVQKVKEGRQHPFSYIQISVILMAVINLIVLFSGSGAAVAGGLYDQKVSISRLLLNFAGRLLSSGQNTSYAFIVYLAWLLLILFPVMIIYNIFKNDKKSQLSAFILSLIETIFLCYLIYRLSSVQRADSGVLSQLTSQLLTYAISIGTSAYFLILSSFMTSILSGYNLFKKNTK